MDLPPLFSLVRAVAAGALVAAAVRGASRIGRSLLGVADEGAELASAVTVLATAVTLGFHVMTATGTFSAPGCALVLALVALLGHRVDGPRAPRDQPGRVAVAVGTAALAVAAWRWLRATVSPALAPDSMTYHLYRAARWVQRGDDAPEDWPDAAGYYEFFPSGGEVFWGYGFALTGDDGCVATVGVLLWLAAAVAAYSFARAHEVAPGRAAIAAVAVVMAPAALSVSTSGYVDTWTLGTFLLAATHARRAVVARCGTSTALMLVAAALHMGTKLSGVPTAVAFGVIAIVAARRAEGGEVARRRVILGAAVAVAVAAPALLRVTLARSSPVYPLPLGSLLPGNAEFVAVHSGALSPRAPTWTWFQTLRAYTVGMRAIDADPLGWGVAWVAAAPLAVFALVASREDRRARVLAAVTLALSFAGVVGLNADVMREMRTSFLPFSPRLTLVAPAALTLYAATLGGRRWDLLWAVIALANVALAVPASTAPAVREAALAALPWAVAAGAVLAAAVRWGGARARWASGIVALALVAVGVGGVRARSRGAILDAMGGPRGARSYEVNPVGGAMRVFWTAGDLLARDCARRTAVAFGWAPPGHTIFRYPLMGQGWTNRLVYAPVTHDGAVIDLADDRALDARVDPGRWYAGLLAEGVDHVVVTPPHPRELRWMLSRPDLFESFGDEALPIGLFRVRARHRCPR